MKLAWVGKLDKVGRCCLCDWELRDANEVEVRQHLFLTHDRIMVSLEVKKDVVEYQGRRLPPDKPLRF